MTRAVLYVAAKRFANILIETLETHAFTHTGRDITVIKRLFKRLNMQRVNTSNRSVVYECKSSGVALT